MAFGAQCMFWWLLPVFFLIGTHKALSKQAYVCSPNNKTEPLECTEGQWVRIDREFYALKSTSSECGTNFTSCSNVVYDVGLLANCNGPITQESGPCEEYVNMDGQKDIKECFKDVTEMSTIVAYSCLPSPSIVDMCKTQSFSTQTNSINLVSPGFLHSNVEGQMCSCSIQGSNLKMKAVDLNVKSGLRWTTLDNDTSLPSAVLDVKKNGNESLWSSNSCNGCDEIVRHNINLFLPSGPTIDVIFADFGLPQQKAWLSIFDPEASLNISCTSSPLPESRIITTTTTATTTTTTTTTTTMTTSTTTSTTQPTTIPPITTAQSTTTSSSDSATGSIDGAASTSSPMNQNNDETSSGPSGQKGQKGKGVTKKSKDDDGDFNSDVIVVLVLFLLLLIVVAVVLGVFIYKKRDKFATTNFKPPVWRWMKRCFSRRGNPYTEGNNPEDRMYTYENELYGHLSIDYTHASSDEEVLREPTKAGESHVPHLTKASSDGTVSQNYDSDSMERATGNDGNVNKDAGDPVSLVNTDTYAAHQAIVGEEVARIKTERKLNRTLDKQNDNYHYKNDNKNNDASNKTTIKGDENKTIQKHKDRKKSEDDGGYRNDNDMGNQADVIDKLESQAMRSAEKGNVKSHARQKDSIREKSYSPENRPVVSSEFSQNFDDRGEIALDPEEDINVGKLKTQNNISEKYDADDNNEAGSSNKGDDSKRQEKITNILSNSLMDIREKLKNEGSKSGSDSDIETGKKYSNC